MAKRSLDANLKKKSRMKHSLSAIYWFLLSLPLVAQEIRNEGIFVTAAGYSETGRFVLIDEIAPNSGGVVSGPDGLVISLNAVFANFAAGGIVEPISIDGIQVILKQLPSGELYVELDEEDWELVFSQTIAEDEWEIVHEDSFFVPDGKGWRLNKDEIPNTLFLRGRLK